ncbi:hypothetical protein QBC32DRAFT_380692 [Pseudoneurospora amorphoporcata]|uniref:Uncharacterized protein n=1 Tax=Pseudoneurospora amorphoporcata TaxID=241081 RepID=A0AAN6SCK3_9PEZI|nr:hypothetical protein QBC32DRAFT_380692 [Pseudoneurospora amorphoporcata]
MDQHSYYQLFNHFDHPQHAQYPPAPVPEPQLADYYYAPASSPSDFIYNSANTTASIFLPSGSSHASLRNESTPSTVLPYPKVMGYGPSRPVEQQSFPTYLPSLPSLPEPILPEPAPGFEEHRRQRQRQRQSTMKMVPPALSLGDGRGSNRESDSDESTVMVKVKHEERSPGPVLVSVPRPMKKWEPRVPTEGMEGEIQRGSGNANGGVWEERGEGVIAPMVPGLSCTSMGMGMEPTPMPKMGLFKPIKWDGPSSSRSNSKAKKTRRARAWEVDENDLLRTYGNQNRTGTRKEYKSRNDETEDEETFATPLSSHPRSSKRRKTSISIEGNNFRTGSADTDSATVIKQEPGLSPSPRATFSRIPMYSHPDATTTSNGYGTGYDHLPSSRSISPLTRVPTPRRFLFPTPDRRGTGTGTGMASQNQPSSRAVVGRDVQLEKGDREKEKRDQRGEGGFWSLAAAAAAQQVQYRGSSEEEQENGWTTISVSGSSEEGEVSSHYENSYTSNSYSFGQDRRPDAPPSNTRRTSSPSYLPYTDQDQDRKWCHPVSQASTSWASSSVHGSAPSLSASQEASQQQQRIEQYQQAIQMVQDTCLEASKRYIRAHCVNRGVRGGGGGDDPALGTDTYTVPRESGESRRSKSASRRKARRRKRKLATRHGSWSPSSRRTAKTASASQFHQEEEEIIPCTSSSDSLLLPNISQICTLLWSRAQSLRLHDTDSIELHTARNMYWLLSWAETVAFAVVPTLPLSANSSSNGGTSNTSASSQSKFIGFVPGGGGVPSLEDEMCIRGRQWRGRRNKEGEEEEEEEGEDGEGSEMLPGSGGNWKEAVWQRQQQQQQQRELEEMGRRVFEEGGMLCEFLGYGEGVGRLARVREFYGF